MINQIDWQYIFKNTRSRVYLLWAILTTIGFMLTHFHQQQNINALWFGISVVGLGYMLKVMPLRIKKLRLIYLSWLVPIAIGLVFSALVFKTTALSIYVSYLGSYWLFVLAAGYFLNGLVDPPAKIYWYNSCLNALAGLLIAMIGSLLPIQYLIAAGVSVVSMLNLWFFRTE